MSVSLNITAYSGKESTEFKKHFNAVKFCIENQLSFPKETSEFFKGRVNGEDLENISTKYLLEYIENGIMVDIPIHSVTDYEKKINISEIPPEVDFIIVKIS